MVLQKKENSNIYIMYREKTRRERYKERAIKAKKLPFSVATVNFKHEGNLAYIIRSAVCFGAREVCVIGGHPPRNIMNEMSGSMFDYIPIKYFNNPSSFIKYNKDNNRKIVSIELPEDSGVDSNSISSLKFKFQEDICFVAGHETLGVPTEILYNSDVVHINMNGIGYCLNTAQAANIVMYEFSKQYEHRYG
jgi:tRNA G18 (ribose-2'-O)-methylase SpoU